MKKKLVFVIVLLSMWTVLLPTSTQPWGTLKKIYYYHDHSQYEKVLEHLQMLDLDSISRTDQDVIAGELIRFGDFYTEQKRYGHAEAFYMKVLDLSPRYWTIYNKLENIDRRRGSWLPNFDHLFKQFSRVFDHFQSSFILVNQVLSILFFSGILVFFIFSIFLFTKYFLLVGSDLIIDARGSFSIKRAAITAALFLWPAVLFSGWMTYPFIICGMLWFYLGENEQKAVKYIIILVGVFTLLYSLNLMLERHVRTDRFKTAQKVFSGQLFEKKSYQSFDDEIKVAQALAYYKNQKYDQALDILNSTADDYKTALKYNLLGNIYFQYDELSESTKYYRLSLQDIDKHNPVTLNNFALTLVKNKKPEVFLDYSKAYPEIEKLRTQNLVLQTDTLDESILWKRLFSNSRVSFNLVVFFKGVLGELMTLPVVYFILLFIGYILLAKKFTARLHLGESNYCSKCAKIIKEASIHRSYKLCDECYQLFTIKDVIFLDAKILKEKELKAKYRKRYMITLLFSIFIPGLNLSFKENNRLFLNFSIGFYFLFLLALVGSANFSRVFAVSPLFFSLVGILAAGLYLLVNLFSIIGDSDGF